MLAEEMMVKMYEMRWLYFKAENSDVPKFRVAPSTGRQTGEEHDTRPAGQDDQ